MGASLRVAEVRRDTALQCVAAMAYEDAFSDLFTAFEQLLLHSEAKKLAAAELLVSYTYASWIIFWSSKPRTRQITALPAHHN